MEHNRIDRKFYFFSYRKLFALTDAAPVWTIAYYFIELRLRNAGNYVEDDYILWKNKLTEKKRNFNRMKTTI